MHKRSSLIILSQAKLTLMEVTKLTEETMLELLIMEYKEILSELSDVQQIPERWGMIMLPLSAGILAVAVNSIKTLPNIGVIILVFLSVATIAIWRLIGYNSMYRVRMLSVIMEDLKMKLSQHQSQELFEERWKGWLQSPRSFLPFLSQRALLDIFSLLYIGTGIVIIIVKFTSF